MEEVGLDDITAAKNSSVFHLAAWEVEAELNTAGIMVGDLNDREIDMDSGQTVDLVSLVALGMDLEGTMEDRMEVNGAPVVLDVLEVPGGGKWVVDPIL